MVKLTHCTLTGVDEATSLVALAELALKFPISEWGFLYSPKQQGKPGRYPSVPFLMDALDILPPFVRVALHVCGAGVQQLLDNEIVVTALVSKIARRHGRVQLNFNQTRNPLDIDQLRAFLMQNRSLSVITQHNEANAEVYRALGDMSNHAVLFDASGGQGKAPEQWPTPLSGVSCGYAGGLGPNTLVNAWTAIQKAINETRSEDGTSYPTWIDMEGALRSVKLDTDNTTFDTFSLAQCEFVLEKISALLTTETVGH